MKLDVRHFYPCSTERWWDMYWDDGFDAMLMKDSTVDREVVEEHEEGGKFIRRLRFTPKAELPGPVAKIVGAKKLVYEQVNTFDRKNGVMHWKVLPSFMDASKFTAEGTLRADPTGSGCESVASGDITVNVRFIGGQIEKQVVSQIKEAYDRMALAGKEWLAANPAGGQS
jgi:hypothetical protein